MTEAQFGIILLTALAAQIVLTLHNVKLWRKWQAAEKALDGCALIISGLSNEVQALRAKAWEGAQEEMRELQQEIADIESEMNDNDEGWQNGHD